MKLHPLLLMTLIPGTVAAASPVLSTSDWTYGQEIRVTGPEMKPGLLQRLCAAPKASPVDYKCYGHYDTEKRRWISEDEAISLWNSTTILFKPKSGLPPDGVLTLRVTTESSYPDEESVHLGDYTARGVVLDVVDVKTGLSVPFMQPGRRYEIQGALLGQDIGTITVGRDRILNTDVVAWTHQSILLDPSKTYVLAEGLQISNGGGASKTYYPAGIAPSSSSSSRKASPRQARVTRKITRQSSSAKKVSTSSNAGQSRPSRTQR